MLGIFLSLIIISGIINLLVDEVVVISASCHALKHTRV